MELIRLTGNEREIIGNLFAPSKLEPSLPNQKQYVIYLGRSPLCMFKLEKA